MLAFMHIRKTGGLTMRAILRKNFGTNNCDCPINDVTHREDWEWIKRCYPNLSSLQGHAVRIGTELEEVFPNPQYFTIVRDPIKRCISHYQHAIIHGQKQPALEEWVAKISNELCRAICGEANSDYAIEMIETRIGFVGMTETFNESMLLWKKWTGLPDLDLIYLPKNIAKSYSTKDKILNDPEAMGFIREQNQEDLKLFEYIRENVYPRQKADYGETLAHDLAEYEQELKNGSNLSFAALMGCAKRHLIYKRGLRDWKSELLTDHKRVA